MIFNAASRAASRLFSPPLRAVLWKSVGLTVAGLFAVWLALSTVFGALVPGMVGSLLSGRGIEWPAWLAILEPLSMILAALALAIGLAYLVAPVTALVAQVFLDDVAEIIEREDYPMDAPGQALPLGRSLVLSARFVGVILVANLVALLLLLVPGINIAAFFLANGYVLGREYFTFAALRMMEEAQAQALRRRHAGSVMAGGLLIAVWLAIPVLNLTTPLFAAALMIHLNKALARKPPPA